MSKANENAENRPQSNAKPAAAGTERVELLVSNTPGVLQRVVGQIRLEGWNIRRLFVDETADGLTSELEIDIEGTHTKLAQVAERLLNLDCVKTVSLWKNGEKLVRRRERTAGRVADSRQKASPVGAKPENAFRILTINPGSTSTKYAVYDDEKLIFGKTITHTNEELQQFDGILAQNGYRRDCILRGLAEAGIEPETLDAISGRGGLLKPIESGTYAITPEMLADLQTASAAVHASALGAIIAEDLGKRLQIPTFVVDPIVVDETDRNAKLTGMPGIERRVVFHALNQKAVARRACVKIGKPYENSRLIVAHLGGGITVGAHRYGRVIDVNDALSGEGAFTPERTGNIPAVPLIELCFSGEYTKDELLRKINSCGGMRGYLGTNDLRTVQKMINDGDEFAALVLDSMAYQVSKEIGAMVAVLEGTLDAIILTGGLAHSSRFTGAIKQRVDKLAPIYVFPGEDEMLALMSGALRVLRGEEPVAVYD